MSKNESVLYFMLVLGAIITLFGIGFFRKGYHKGGGETNQGEKRNPEPSEISLFGIKLKTTNAALIIFVTGVFMIVYGIDKIPEERSKKTSVTFNSSLKKVLHLLRTDFRELYSTPIDSTRGLYRGAINFFPDTKERVDTINKEYILIISDNGDKKKDIKGYSVFQDLIAEFNPYINKKSDVDVQDSENYTLFTNYNAEDYLLRLERKVQNGTELYARLRIKSSKK